MNVKKQKNKCKSLNSYFAQTLVVVTEATIEIFCWVIVLSKHYEKYDFATGNKT